MNAASTIRTLSKLLCLTWALVQPGAYAQDIVKFIAHRGGVADSTFTENGMPALKEAARLGYGMIETDLRVTADGVLITNHDADFVRFYGVNRKVTDMKWEEIKLLRSRLDGCQPLLLEDVLRFCREKGMAVMLDNKIAGLDTALFGQVVALLDRYQLREGALMIGTDESTGFFTGRVRLSCSRRQLEANMRQAHYHARNYYLFERPANVSAGDVQWAAENGIRVVAAINKFHYRKSADMMADAQRDCARMLAYGVREFQIDSEFRKFLLK
nr:glycerophosphodiester phosphodiesterase family protein [uncultured Dyadobacter sp.]